MEPVLHCVTEYIGSSKDLFLVSKGWYNSLSINEKNLLADLRSLYPQYISIWTIILKIIESKDTSLFKSVISGIRWKEKDLYWWALLASFATDISIIRSIIVLLDNPELTYSIYGVSQILRERYMIPPINRIDDNDITSDIENIIYLLEDKYTKMEMIELFDKIIEKYDICIVKDVVNKILYVGKPKKYNLFPLENMEAGLFKELYNRKYLPTKYNELANSLVTGKFYVPPIKYNYAYMNLIISDDNLHLYEAFGGNAMFQTLINDGYVEWGEQIVNKLRGKILKHIIEDKDMTNVLNFISRSRNALILGYIIKYSGHKDNVYYALARAYELSYVFLLEDALTEDNIVQIVARTNAPYITSVHPNNGDYLSAKGINWFQYMLYDEGTPSCNIPPNLWKTLLLESLKAINYYNTTILVKKYKDQISSSLRSEILSLINTDWFRKQVEEILS